LFFAFISHRSFPGVVRPKLLLAVAIILAGCGGSGRGNWQQVQGDGFRFNAPAAWTVSGAAATNGAVDRVEVHVFRLVRPYERARRVGATRELDLVAGRVAGQLKGSVVSRRTLQVAGLDARSYAIRFDAKTEVITFVLEDLREYQLLCRRAAGADAGPCTELVQSFALR
jgi:hypothetical protein